MSSSMVDRPGAGITVIPSHNILYISMDFAGLVCDLYRQASSHFFSAPCSVLEITVISAKNVDVLSLRISGGIYLSIDGYLSTIKPLLRDRTVVWDEIVKLTNLSWIMRIQLRTALEFGTTLGRGELIGEVETSEEHLLSHGDVAFEISFPAIRRQGFPFHLVPVLKLKACSRDVHVGAQICRASLESVGECESGRTVSQDTHVETVMTDTMTYCTPLDSIDEGEFLPTEFDTDRALLDFMDECESGNAIQQDTHFETAMKNTNMDCALGDFIDEVEIPPTNADMDPALLEDLDTDCTAFDFIGEFETEHAIAQNTDEGHAQFAEYIAGCGTSHLKKALDCFAWVLEKCPTGHGARAAALTNLAWARLTGVSHNNPEDIDSIILLFREALELRPVGHPDHVSSAYHLAYALNQFDKSENVDIRECVALYCALLPLCPEGTAFHGSVLYGHCLDDVIRKCNDLSGCKSFEDLYVRRLVVRLCHPASQHCPRAFEMLARTLCERGSVQEVEESIHWRRIILDNYRRQGHPQRYVSLNNLVSALRHYYILKGESCDLNESIALCEESLRQCPVGHEHIVVILNNLGSCLIHRFIRERNIEDIDRAINALRTVLLLLQSKSEDGSAKFHLHLALGLITRYTYAAVDRRDYMDLEHATCSCHQAFRLQRPDDPPASTRSAIQSFFSRASQRLEQINNQLMNRGLTVVPGQESEGSASRLGSSCIPGITSTLD